MAVPGLETQSFPRRSAPSSYAFFADLLFERLDLLPKAEGCVVMLFARGIQHALGVANSLLLLLARLLTGGLFARACVSLRLLPLLGERGLTALPMTASGKVQRVLRRDRAKQELTFASVKV
ncbi:hypothetical protein AS156_06465 [Bradyrhizobium macuxiense]|uniref:Uncharacterized protein n=1 Tax=Bradyrhizobium macuxiense TaxID=1755647 RepID=A0A109JT32_9BRAD|nr:hypothetical protein AS156_06465 [Bradyrhizobium macuxiense]